MNRAILFIIIIGSLVSFSSCNDGNKPKEKPITSDIIKNPVSADGKADTTDLPVITFKKLEHDFGLIIDGEVVEYSFEFTNTGGSDLVLAKVSATCGCTIPTYDRKPIAPGEKGKITVKFNSENRNGNQHKTITVLSNAQPNTVELEITANVIRP